MRRICTLFLVTALATAAQAETITCNANGAVVTYANGTTLYLGKSCDAARKGGGTGYWFNAASFLAVFIEGEPYRVAEGRGIDCLPFCQNTN